MAEDGLEETPLNSGEDEKHLTDYDALFQAGNKKEKFTQNTVVGEFRNPKRFSWIEWAFLVITTISLLAVIALNIERFVTFHNNFYNLTNPNNESDPLQCSEWYCTTDFVFTLCVLVNLVFCFYYCYNGLFRERQFELLAFVAATILISLYVIGNYIFTTAKHRQSTTVKEVRLAFVCVFVPVDIVLAILTWWKMGYLVFNVIGSNKKLTNAYHFRSFFETLQYFHVEIMANIVVLAFALNGDLISMAEKVIVLLLLLLLFAVSFMGTMAVTWEIKAAVLVWYTLMLPNVAYYVYKLIEVSMHWSSYLLRFEEHYKDDQKATQSTLVTVGVALLVTILLGFAAVVLLMVSMTVVFRNFGLGLKDKAVPPFSWCARYFVRLRANATTH